MIRFGTGLEKRQAVLARIVEIGAECFMMTASCVYARKLVPDPREMLKLAMKESRR